MCSLRRFSFLRLVIAAQTRRCSEDPRGRAELAGVDLHRALDRHRDAMLAEHVRLGEVEPSVPHGPTPWSGLRACLRLRCGGWRRGLERIALARVAVHWRGGDVGFGGCRVAPPPSFAETAASSCRGTPSNDPEQPGANAVAPRSPKKANAHSRRRAFIPKAYGAFHEPAISNEVPPSRSPAERSSTSDDRRRRHRAGTRSARACCAPSASGGSARIEAIRLTARLGTALREELFVRGVERRSARIYAALAGASIAIFFAFARRPLLLARLRGRLGQAWEWLPADVGVVGGQCARTAR